MSRSVDFLAKNTFGVQNLNIPKFNKITYEKSFTWRPLQFEYKTIVGFHRKK